MKDLIFELCNASGVSGNESEVLKVAYDKLKKYAKVKILPNGSLIACLGDNEAKRHIMLDAHIDQIGLVVTDIDDNGFLKIAPCGGIDVRVLPGSVVKVYGKEEFIGILSCLPPHLSNNPDKFPKIERLSIDVGLDKGEAESKIPLGSNAVFFCEPKELLGNRIASKALDNRAGVAALIRCVELISERNIPDNVKLSIVLSSQEETSSLGAVNAAFSEFPTESIVVDVSFATQNSVSIEESGELSKGPMIGMAPSLSKNITSKLFLLSEENDIPYQTEVMGGKTGTNADQISSSRSGIKTGLISIPQRYMHTPVEVVDIDDIENTARLLALYIEKGGDIND